jgi:muramidase (phage lysozyme)
LKSIREVNMPATINSPSAASCTIARREQQRLAKTQKQRSYGSSGARSSGWQKIGNILRIPIYAFLKAIAEAEGGGYDFKYGAVKGKKNDPWRFTDYSTHPGPGFGGRTTAAGMYQENIDTWREMGGNMGLTDFTPETQDLIAIEILRVIKAIDSIQSGDISTALEKASRRWSSLPQGEGKSGFYPNQPSVSFPIFESNYRRLGGTVK